jgi:hypothetical protein
MRTGAMGKLLSLDARGKFGWSGGFGRLAFGYTRLGFYSWWAGIYSKKYYYGKPYISRMKFYRPTNPRTILQQNWRAVHAYATYLWRSFDPETQEPYEMKGKRAKMTGYNFFLSYFLKNRPHGFGAIYFGWGL